jgi:ABC-2 family transporter protein
MNALPSATRHQFFSFARISAIASNTLLELIRLKVFYFMLIFALVMIGSSFFLVKLTFQAQFQVLKDVALGAMSIFTWLLAVLSTALLLPKDIEDRTLYTILAKPVPRLEYLLGKLLGVLLLLFVALSLMCALFVLVLYAKEYSAIAELARTTAPGALDAEIRNIRAETFTWNLIPGIIFIYLKAALCAALTLLLSTFASSTIFTIMISVVAYIIGHVQPIARSYIQNTHGAGPLTIVYLALVSLLIPDLTAFSLVDDIAAGTAISLNLFVQTAGLGITYIVVYFLVGYFIFWFKEL